MSSVYLGSKPLYLNSFCFGYRPVETPPFLPEYIGHLLRSAHVRREIIRLAQGSTRFNLSKKGVMELKIPITPFAEEQRRIAAVLSVADREIDQLTQKLDTYKQQKKGLMQQLLTGKKRVGIAKSEAA
jgi:type I restriction enzyme, S subunit